MKNSENVICIRLFGSMARGDNDSSSDADILVVVEDRSGKVSEETIIEFCLPLIGRKPSISWYGRRRLLRMFEEGHLFAWHLFLESRALSGPPTVEELFGRPTEYTNALIDIESFRLILDGVSEAIRTCPTNAIYELGLIYVCLRNIAMSASWQLAGRPDFTRYSPYMLKQHPLSIARADYELAMACRMASQRGCRLAKSITGQKVTEVHRIGKEWSDNMWEMVKENV